MQRECLSRPQCGAEIEPHSNRRRVSTLHSDVHGIARTGAMVDDLLQDWSKKTAQHYLDKAGEVKDLLLVMARTAESLGHKDDRFAQQLDSVTTQLQTIASLDDVSKMRVSLEESARQLKSSVAQMSAENKSVIEHLRVEVLTYQAKLEKANHLASCDALTGLGSRVWIEAQMQQRIDSGVSFSVLMMDIKEFRRVNDEVWTHGGRSSSEGVCKRIALLLPPVKPCCPLVRRYVSRGSRCCCRHGGRASGAAARMDKQAIPDSGETGTCKHPAGRFNWTRRISRRRLRADDFGTRGCGAVCQLASWRNRAGRREHSQSTLREIQRFESASVRVGIPAVSAITHQRSQSSLGNIPTSSSVLKLLPILLSFKS